MKWCHEFRVHFQALVAYRQHLLVSYVSFRRTHKPILQSPTTLKRVSMYRLCMFENVPFSISGKCNMVRSVSHYETRYLQKLEPTNSPKINKKVGIHKNTRNRQERHKWTEETWKICYAISTIKVLIITLSNINVV